MRNEHGTIEESGAKIGRQIVLPLSKAFEIAWRGIRIRLWRSIITMSGIVLAIAFLMSVWATSAIISGLQEVAEDDPRYPLIKRALQEHAIASHSFVVRTAVVGWDEEEAAGAPIPPKIAIHNFLQPLQEVDPFLVGNDIETLKAVLKGAEGGAPDALIVAGVPKAFASMEAVSAVVQYVKTGGTLIAFGAPLLPPATPSEVCDLLATILPARIAEGTVVVHGMRLKPGGSSSFGTTRWSKHPDLVMAATKEKRGSVALARHEGKGIIWSLDIGEGSSLWYPVAKEPEALRKGLNWIGPQGGFLSSLLRWSARTSTAGSTAARRNLWLITLSLLVCIVGITNAMLMSVTERFREIGTMKCLGALDKFVVKLFLIESAMQGTVGSFMGVVLGFALAFLRMIFAFRIADPVTEQTHWLTFAYFPGPSILFWAVLAVAIGASLSIVAGIYPAYRAAKMEPVEAMRVQA